MNHRISRRDLFKFIGGSAAGLIFTPIPWKLLDDSAIWTQNWPWIPEPLKGKFQTKYTSCSLCPVGCGVQARCVGGIPVSLTGIAGHPTNGGALCAIGLAGHHLAYHPARALQPFKRIEAGSSPVKLDEIVDAVGKSISDLRISGSSEFVVILDGQPNRTLSTFYRRFLSEIPNGIYATTPSSSSRSFTALDEMTGSPSNTLAYDIENAKTIVSFGAPILDGWGAPGRMLSMFNKKGKSGEKGFRLIQIEPRASRTAMLAQSWIPLNPGTEAALAFGLANVMIREGSYSRDARHNSADFDSFAKMVKSFTPEVVAEITGVREEEIVRLAREISTAGPTLIIGGGDPGSGPMALEDEIAVMSLNFLLGNVGRSGGLVKKLEMPQNVAGKKMTMTKELQDLPDHSIRILIVDGAGSGSALPRKLVEKKLVSQGSLVVSLSPYLTSDAMRADYLLPTPAFLESLSDVPGSAELSTASFGISAPMISAPAGITEPLTLLRKISEKVGVSIGDEGRTLEDCIKQRVVELHKAKKGSVFVSSDKKYVEVKSISTADDLWKMLVEGGCWVGQSSPKMSSPKFSFLGKTAERTTRLQSRVEGVLNRSRTPKGDYPLALMPFGWTGASASGQVSPILSKVYQESNLRHSSHDAMVNPATGKSYGLTDGKQIEIKTESGSMKAKARFSASVMPGIIHVEVGPDTRALPAGQMSGEDVLAICKLEEDDTWRITQAKVREV